MKILARLGCYLVGLATILLIGGAFVPWAKVDSFGYKDYHSSVGFTVLAVGVAVLLFTAKPEWIYLFPIIGEKLKKNDEGSTLAATQPVPPTTPPEVPK